MHDPPVMNLQTSGAVPLLHARLPGARSRSRGLAMMLALLVVLCQAAFIAQACANVASGGDLAADCHSPAETDSRSSGHDRLSPACEAPALTADPVTTPLIAPMSLLFVAIGQHALQAPARTAPLPLQFREAQCRPPPLTILHCRFLN